MWQFTRGYPRFAKQEPPKSGSTYSLNRFPKQWISHGKKIKKSSSANPSHQWNKQAPPFSQWIGLVGKIDTGNDPWKNGKIPMVSWGKNPNQTNPWIFSP